MSSWLHGMVAMYSLPHEDEDQEVLVLEIRRERKPEWKINQDASILRSTDDPDGWFTELLLESQPALLDDHARFLVGDLPR